MRRDSQTLTMHGSDAYVKLMRVLTEYLSPRTAITIVNQSLAVVYATPESLDDADLSAVLEHLLPAAQAFCDPHQFDELTLDLSSLGLARTSSVPPTRPPSTEAVRPRSTPAARPMPSSRPPAFGAASETVSLRPTHQSSGTAARPSGLSFRAAREDRVPSTRDERSTRVDPRGVTVEIERVSLKPLAPPRSRGT